MLRLKERMVRVVLMLSSALAAALTPVRAALRPVAVRKSQPVVARRRRR